MFDVFRILPISAKDGKFTFIDFTTNNMLVTVRVGLIVRNLCLHF
jgi:hypothetical protein